MIGDETPNPDAEFDAPEAAAEADAAADGDGRIG